MRKIIYYVTTSIDSYISNSLQFENPHEQVQVQKVNLDKIKSLKNTKGSPIYLCGGGTIAGWLLEYKMIDMLKIKLNPLILGSGTTLFGGTKKQFQLKLMDSQKFNDGIQIITYKINY